MSYVNDKNNMNKQMNDRKKRLMFIIKITFIALFVSLVTFIITLFVSFFVDSEPPVIKPVKSDEIIGYLGEAPTYRQYVTVTDDKDDEPKLNVNSTAVDINNVGRYPVYYQAVDKAGNESYYQITYVVKSKVYSREKLDAMVADIADKVITKNTNKETQVREIYSFANKIIDWSTGMSNIPNINRDNWKTDWIEEAIRTLELYEKDACDGDCYSYYSVSKAFFEYFGIKNVGLRRDMSIDEDYGTHFWQIVDIGGGKWYYYDGTRLAGKFSDGSKNACLITHEKLTSYKTSKNEDYFYKISKVPACVDYSSAGISTYPKIATEEIN